MEKWRKMKTTDRITIAAIPRGFVIAAAANASERAMTELQFTDGTVLYAAGSYFYENK